MKTIIRLEAIGDNESQTLKLFNEKLESVCHGLGKYMTKGMNRRPWVAEISDFDGKYKYVRTFINGKKDYSESNGIGSRGVYLHYILESNKIYQVHNLVSWSSCERYFCLVDDNGDIQKITEKEVIAWLKKASE